MKYKFFLHTLYSMCLVSSMAYGQNAQQAWDNRSPNTWDPQKLQKSMNTYHPSVDPTLKIRNAWITPTEPGQQYALVNFAMQTPVSAQIDSIFCPLSQRVGVYDSNPNASHFKDRFSAVRLPLSLSPATTYRFEPQGRKLVLIGLKGPLKIGDKVPLTFQLSSAMYNNTTSAAISVLIPVRNPPSVPGAPNTSQAPQPQAPISPPATQPPMR